MMNWTGVAVSIGYPDKENAHYYAGKVSKETFSKPISKNTLFQIGSITKSFTAVIALQLESEGVLNINQTIGDWLPEYQKWKDVTIEQLLNMTSGIPGYVTIPDLAKKITDNINRQWTDKEIVDIAYAYPHSTRGYNYSDTNYLIVAMIIEKATKDTFENQLNKRILHPYKSLLHNTIYDVKPYSRKLIHRLARAYYYGTSTGPLQRGDDVTEANMSMGGAAGAIISTADNLVDWVRLLFSGRLIPSMQEKELTNLVSMKTGKPITITNENDRYGYGLGITQGYTKDTGRYWWYAGDTMGHRAYYMMVPCNHMIVSATFNSSPFVDTTVKEHGSDLMVAIYTAVIASKLEYQCKSRVD